MALCGIDTLLFPLVHLDQGRGFRLWSILLFALEADGILDTDECDTALALFMLFTGDHDGMHLAFEHSCTWDTCFHSFSFRCGARGLTWSSSIISTSTGDWLYVLLWLRLLSVLHSCFL